MQKVEIPNAELEELYTSQRLTLREIGTRFGVTEATVLARLQEHSIPIRSRSDARMISLERGTAYTRKGCPPWNKGISRTVKELEHISDGKRKKKKERQHIRRVLASTLHNGMAGNKEAGERISQAAKARWQDPEWREKQCQIRKELWQNPEHQERQIKAILRGLCKRPTSYEQKIIDLIEKHSLPFKYVGNGEVIIGYVNPDFININGQKSLIEVYSKRWHKPSYEETRARRFARYGYRTLFLADNDLCCRNWEDICLAKIRDFYSAVCSETED